MTETVNPRSTACLGIVVPKKAKTNFRTSQIFTAMVGTVVNIRGFHASSEIYDRPDLECARSIRRSKRRDALGGLGIWMYTSHGMDELGLPDNGVLYEATLTVPVDAITLMTRERLIELQKRPIRPRWATISRDLERTGMRLMMIVEPDGAQLEMVALDTYLITKWRKM